MLFTLRQRTHTESSAGRTLRGTHVVKAPRIHVVAQHEDDYTREHLRVRPSIPNMTSGADRPAGRRISYSRRDSKYRRPAHYITRLPPELLAYIFELGAEDNIRLPILVSHVCSTWRDIALRTPTLWRHINLDARSTMWRERMGRAKACTLDVELRPRVQLARRTLRRSYLDARSVEHYMHLVAPQIPRWRSLVVQFQHYAPYLWNAALSECCGIEEGVEAPNLEHLELVHPLNDDSKEFLLFNGCAPRLQSATLEGIRLTWLPSLFSNLTTLDYTHHGFTRGYDAFLELYGMLQVSSKLQDLRLTFPRRTRHAATPQFPQMSTNTLLYMHDLRNLSINVTADDIPSALIQLMSRLRLKGLRSLSLQCPPPPAPPIHGRHHRETYTLLPPFSRLRNFYRALPRMSHLNHLRIEHSWCDIHFMLALLKFHVPQLKHLAIASGHVTDAFLWTLGEQLRGRNFYVGHLDMDEYVPGVWHNGAVSLSTLDVLEVSEGRISTDGLVGVVRRMLGGGVLWVQELWLRDCKNADSEMMERAGRFGVNVRVWANNTELREGEKNLSQRPARRPSVWKRFSR